MILPPIHPFTNPSIHPSIHRFNHPSIYFPSIHTFSVRFLSSSQPGQKLQTLRARQVDTQGEHTKAIFGKCSLSPKLCVCHTNILKCNVLNCCSPFYGNYSAYTAGYNPEFNYTQAQVKSQINQQSAPCNYLHLWHHAYKIICSRPNKRPPGRTSTCTLRPTTR